MHGVPAYGWMVRRTIAREMVAMWPAVNQVRSRVWKSVIFGILNIMMLGWIHNDFFGLCFNLYDSRIRSIRLFFFLN